MRRFTPSERRLLLMLFAVLFVAGNLLFFHSLIKRDRMLNLELTQLGMEQREAEAWMASRDFWMKKKSWLDGKQTHPGTEGQEQAQLLEKLQKSAREQNITISSQKLDDPRVTEDYREVSVQLEIKGPLGSVGRWLAGLQDPELFQAVPHLTLKSDAEPPEVICNLTVVRWYSVR